MASTILLSTYDNEFKKARYITKDQKRYNYLWKIVENNIDIISRCIDIMYDGMGNRYFAYGYIAEALLLKESADSIDFQKLSFILTSMPDISLKKPDALSYESYLMLLLTRNDVSLEKAEREKIINIANTICGTSYFDKVSSSIALSLKDNDFVFVGDKKYNVKNSDVYKLANEITKKKMMTLTGGISAESEERNFKDLRYFVLGNQNFEDDMPILTYEFFFNHCAYTEFIDNLNLSITTDLEEYGFYIDFFEEVVERYDEIIDVLLKSNDEKAKDIEKDVELLYNLLRIRIYDYSGTTF